MLLSIVIPVYNLEEYIGRCLDSCLAQTVQGGYEIICVNDGSKDNSLAVLREYESKYPNIRIINKPNGGVSSARNEGIEAATGEYIWFVDGDDWIAEGCLAIIERAISAQVEPPDTVLFSFAASDTFAQKNASQNTYTIELLGAYGGLKNSYSNSVCGRWMRSRIIKTENILFNTKMKYGEDTLFVAQYTMKTASTLTIDAPFYYYYQRAQSAMNNLNAQAHCYCMLNLVMAYKRFVQSATDESVREKMENAVVRGMQAVCRDLCLYCPDRRFVKLFLNRLKKNKVYPFGVDWKQFRRDKKQSLKNDVMNWMFGLLSFRWYFWFCWYLCGLLFKSKRVHTFELEFFDDVLSA
jgi:glycosyltransferase involved in cell wall biosynthesis